MDSVLPSNLTSRSCRCHPPNDSQITPLTSFLTPTYFEPTEPSPGLAGQPLVWPPSLYLAPPPCYPQQDQCGVLKPQMGSAPLSELSAGSQLTLTESLNPCTRPSLLDLGLCLPLICLLLSPCCTSPDTGFPSGMQACQSCSHLRHLHLLFPLPGILCTQISTW